MIYCEDCKARLYPSNPEVGGYLLRTGQYFVPLCQSCSHSGDIQLTDIEDRIRNLEAISAMPGQIPRQYQDRLQQLQGEVVHIHKELHERKGTTRKYKQYT